MIFGRQVPACREDVLMQTLSPRLLMVEGLVPVCGCAADIGTDHGYLLAALLESGKCARGYGSDLRPGPLDAARRTVSERGLSGRAELLLSDGADRLPVEEIDALVFAGMGGELIAELVLRDPRLRSPEKLLICQPMTRASQLRTALCGAGFGILREDACREGRRLYQAAVFAWTGVPRTLTAAEAAAGRLPYRENPDAAAILRSEAGRLRKVAAACTDAVRAEEGAALAAELERLLEEGAR